MKDQYVGDVNDYVKYALLRTLAQDASGLAVAWMATPSDGRSDGLRLRYLAQPRTFQRIDPDVFRTLDDLVTNGQRTIRDIEMSSILRGAAFVSDLLRDDLTAREEYFERVWCASSGRALLFFDPDNGLEVRSVQKGKRNSSKYLYWDELATAYSLGHSLVVYQHFPRRARAAFVRDLSSRASSETQCPDVHAVVTAHVAFLILPQRQWSSTISARLNAFATRASLQLATSW